MYNIYIRNTYGGIMSSREDLSKEVWVNAFDEESAQKFREQLIGRAEMDMTSPILIYIDSYGGSVDALAKMVATMNEIPNKTITVCMGKAMSCGAILLSHGDYRFCDPLSRVMIHNVSSVAWGDIDSLHASVTETERLQKLFIGLLATNCGKTYSDVRKSIKDASDDGKEIYLDAQGAMDYGVVDEVGAPILAPKILWEYFSAPTKVRGKGFIPKDGDQAAVLEMLGIGVEQAVKKKKAAKKKKATKKKAVKKKATKKKATKKKATKKKATKKKATKNK